MVVMAKTGRAVVRARLRFGTEVASTHLAKGRSRPFGIPTPAAFATPKRDLGMNNEDQTTQDRIAASKAAYEARRMRVWTSYSDPAEFAEVKRAAKAAGLKPGEYLRAAERAYRQRRYMVPADIRQRLEALTTLLRNIATSLNQVARFTNTLQKKRGWLGKKPFDWREAEARVHELEREVKDFIRQPPEEGP